MSHASKRDRHSKKPVKPHDHKASLAKQQSQKKIVAIVITAILAAIPFGLGEYFEYNSPDPFDSGAYVYSAKHILDGAKIGIDEKPSAQMGTLLLNMLGVWLSGYNEIGAKTIQGILQAAALILMFIAMRKLFGTLSAAIGVIIASIYLSAPLIAKFGNVKEQYMIAFMVMGISCLILRQLGGQWWHSILAGAFLMWAPLFKQTGASAIIATGLFLIVQPLFKHRTIKQTAADIGLLITGAILSIAPIYIWLALTKVPVDYWPFSFAFKLLPAKGAAAPLGGAYIAKSRQLQPFSEQWPRVLRYYALLILPIALATGSIITRLIRMVLSKLGRLREDQRKFYDRFVILFAVWWLLDMAFIWISPRSYEQYYLPLNASAAMLGGYLIALYRNALSASVYNKTKWVLVGIAGFILMIAMSWHIFFGIEKSPHSGKNYSQKKRGYAQKLRDISRYKTEKLMYPWETVSDYIRTHSTPADKIYVWGWVPGIYVRAQRMCPAPVAFTSEMHVLPPESLSNSIKELLAVFEKEPPKFIVDTRKIHFPWNRLPLELWPMAQNDFLPNNPQIIAEYDAVYTKMLREKISPDEALRYEIMKPFREFIMQNYEIIQVFSDNVLFRLKDSAAKKGP